MTRTGKVWGKTLWVLTLAVFAWGSEAFGFDAGKAAEIFHKAMRDGSPLPIVQIDPGEKTAENAYKIQALVLKKILTEDSLAGYKAGLTTAAQIQRFKSPGAVSGPLLKSGMLQVAESGKSFSIKAFPGIMLEVEFAFKAAVPIDAPVEDERELKKKIASVHAALEIPQVYFADMANIGFFDLTASGVGCKRFVAGPPHEIGLDLDAMEVSLTLDGVVVVNGKGADVLGGQWKTLLWLVNDVVSRGGRIEAGHYLLTGAMGGMIPAKPGKYTATYPFESMSFEILP
ncbi:MAG: hypothetical protein LBD04_05830 [Synergistaceae bacterium]|jgi:2-keto-4-pentenoate hydratase|nr:hypothetical protein [Synergistaceae bacterium]